MKTYFKLALLFWCLSISVNAQVGISTNNPNKDAVLDLNRTDGTSAKGLLLPKVALSATNNFYPLTSHIAGMKVYNTASSGSGSFAVTPGEYINDGIQWIRTSSINWQLDGNINGNERSIGTNDNFDLPIKTNNIEKMRITSDGQLLLNTTTPLPGGAAAKIQINNGTTAGAIQLVDGTQGAGKILTSDGEGVASWKAPASQYTILGVIPATQTTAPITFTKPIFYTGCYIDLPAGQWNVSSTMYFVADGTACVKPGYQNTGFMSFFLSTSSTANTPPTYASNIKSIIIPPLYLGGSDFINCYGTGTIPISISSPQRIYVWGFIATNTYNSTLPNLTGNIAIASGASANGTVGIYGPYTQLFATPITY